MAQVVEFAAPVRSVSDVTAVWAAVPLPPPDVPPSGTSGIQMFDGSDLTLFDGSPLTLFA